MKRIEIKHRSTNTCLWSEEIEDQRTEAQNLGAAVIAARKAGANLSGAYLRGADLSGVGKVKTFRIFTGLYCYVSMAILAKDGTPWVRMGCILKTVEEWDRIGIRTSNPVEFQDDGSERCEERARAFEFARATALRLAEIAVE